MKDKIKKAEQGLKKVERNLKKLQREEKKLTGKEYLENLKKQNQELEKQRKYLKDKAQIAALEMRRQQSSLNKDYGLKFNEEGEITNYSDRYQVTHGKIGMDDINSENAYVQEVVADYVKALKNIGVDGIRWDAAKHIGLPSEGCDFWSAVTQEGLYNYGEILQGPCDKDSKAEDKAVNNALMKEYTDYMSVTDSSYATELVNAFKKGNAPKADGNWVNRGVEKDKLGRKS